MKLHSVVFDASTLILLAKTDLLQIMAREVNILISPVVQAEALARPDLYDAQVIARMMKEGEIQVLAAGSADEIAEIQRQFNLAEGEASALWAAKKEQHTLAIDDGPGIRAAKVFGVPFVTALQVLVGLSTAGILDKPSALAKLEALVKWGRYGAQLVGDARQRIQEGR